MDSHRIPLACIIATLEVAMVSPLVPLFCCETAYLRSGYGQSSSATVLL